LSFSYWIDNLGLGKTCCYIHQTFSWSFQLAGYFTSSTNAIKLSGIIITAPSTSFLAPFDASGECGNRQSLRVVYDQPVGNPKRKV
jgi:hypothetical protein